MIPLAIPSKNRFNSSFTTINALNYNYSDCYIFVNDSTEEILYKKYFNTLGTNPNIIVTNTSGISSARNYILKYFDGDNILMCDDDITGLYRLNKSSSKNLIPLSSEEIFDLIGKGFSLLKKNKTKLWGVYPIRNSFFMSDFIVSAGFVIGTFCGVICDYKNIKYDTSMKLKEDYDFTLQHIMKYKKIIRFNNICVDAKHYSNSGGCQDYRNLKEENNSCEILLNRYPQFVKLNPSRPGEILLRFKYEN